MKLKRRKQLRIRRMMKLNLSSMFSLRDWSLLRKISTNSEKYKNLVTHIKNSHTNCLGSMAKFSVCDVYGGWGWGFEFGGLHAPLIKTVNQADLKLIIFHPIVN